MNLFEDAGPDLAKQFFYSEAVALLAERLVLGGAADAEFFSRLGRCAEAFKERPILCLIWLPKLQSAAESAIYNGRELWRVARQRL